MNWGHWSGGHKPYRRRDGAQVDDERESFGQSKDYLLRWALVTIWAGTVAFMFYINSCQQQLLKDNADIKAGIATLMERTTNMKSDVAGLKSDNAYIQQEIDQLHTLSK